MKLIQYNNENAILFISGMFAGSWTWSKCRKEVIGNHLLIEEPLMGISNSVYDLVDTIAEKVSSLPYTVTVVGNSLGGYVALALAERLPQQVDQVLISGSAGFSKVHLDIKDCLSKEKIPVLGQRLADIICYDHSKALQEDKERLIADLTANLRNMLGLFRGCNEVAAAEVLGRIDCPIKACWGEYDVVSPFDDAKPILDKHRVDCTLLKNCGHSPMYECPKEFADWVNKCVTEYRRLSEIAA